MPSSLIVLALGIAMVVKEEAWAFGDAWILIGFVGILFSALTGALFLGPESGRVAKMIEAEGPDDPEVQRRMKRLFLVSRIETRDPARHRRRHGGQAGPLTGLRETGLA